jgi:menaquinone-dependent protoporphyrinogen oxidase
MHILVAAASKHGSTTEIARDIGATLLAALEGDATTVDVRAAEEVTAVDDYDAVVLGSAVYMGHWLEPARRLVDKHGAALAARPTWLFSSGPVGDPPKPDEEPVDVAALVAATDARGHQVFAGKLDRDRLGFAERAVMIALRAPQGDFRDWAAIRAWTSGIAAELASTRPARQ